MTLQQLTYLCEIVRCKLNISSAARALGTSQPSVSQQIRLLEEDLKVTLFVRSRNRLIGLTPKGEPIVLAAQNVLAGVATLKGEADAPTRVGSPRIHLVSTHAQARYVLPGVIRRFKKLCPDATVHIVPRNDEKLWRIVSNGQADMAIATDADDIPNSLAKLPCQPMRRSLFAPRGHPLLKERKLTLEVIAKYPLVTTDERLSGPQRLVRAFTARGITPKIEVTATNEDVVKACVEEGLGVGILASIAFDPSRDTKLEAVDVTALLDQSITNVIIKKSMLQIEYMATFIECFSPLWTRKALSAVALGL